MIKPIPDPFKTDKRLVRRLGVYTVQLVKTGPRHYTAVCAVLPNWSMVIAGFTAPNRIPYPTVDADLIQSIAQHVADAANDERNVGHAAVSPETAAAILEAQPEVQSGLPQHLLELGANMVECPINGIHFWFDFAAQTFYCEGMPDFVGDLINTLSKQQIHRLKQYILTNKKELFDKHTTDLLSQAAAKATFDSMTTTPAEDKTKEDEGPGTPHKTVLIGVEGVGNFNVQLWQDALDRHWVAGVEQWSKLYAVLPNYKSEEEAVEGVRSEIKKRLGTLFCDGILPPEIELVTEAAANIEHIGPKTVYVVQTSVGYMSVIGLKNGAHITSDGATMIEAVDQVTEALAQMYLDSITPNQDNPEDTGTFMLTKDQIEANGDGHLLKDDEPALSNAGLPMVDTEGMKDAEEDTKEIVIADADGNVEAEAPTEVPDAALVQEIDVEVRMPADDPRHERKFEEYDVKRWVTDDEPVVYMLMQYKVGSRDVMEVTGRSKYQFISPKFADDGSGQEQAVFDEDGNLQTEPTEYDYNVIINIAQEESVEKLKALKAPDWNEPNAVMDFQRQCFALFAEKAEVVITDHIKVIADKIEQVREHGFLMELSRKASKGDLAAQALLKQRMAARQKAAAQSNPMVSAVSEAEGKALGVESVDNMGNTGGPTREQKRAMSRRGKKRVPKGH